MFSGFLSVACRSYLSYLRIEYDLYLRASGRRSRAVARRGLARSRNSH